MQYSRAVILFNVLAERFPHVRDHVKLDDLFGHRSLTRVYRGQMLQEDALSLLYRVSRANPSSQIVEPED